MYYLPKNDHVEGWKLTDEATNQWAGQIENHAGEQVIDLSPLAVVDFKATYEFAKKMQRKMNDEELEEHWERLGDVPVREEDGNLVLDEQFQIDGHVWEEGTDREEIWHWFDELHSEGVVKGLMQLT